MRIFLIFIFIFPSIVNTDSTDTVEFSSEINKYISSTLDKNSSIEDSNAVYIKKKEFKPEKKYKLPRYKPPSPANLREAIDIEYRWAALDLYEKKDFADCITQFKKVSTLNDTDRQYLAHCYIRNGKYEEAHRYFKKIKNRPYELVLLATSCALLSNDNVSATQFCRDYLQQQNIPLDKKQEIHELLGKVYFLQKQFINAVNEWKKSIEGRSVIPDYITYFIGVSEFYNENYDKAREQFRKVTTRNNNEWTKQSNYFMATIEAQSGNYFEARQILLETNINQESPNTIECDILKKLTYCNYQIALNDLKKNNYKRTKYEHLTNAIEDLKTLHFHDRNYISITIAYTLLKRLNEVLNTTKDESNYSSSEALDRLLSSFDENLTQNDKSLLKLLGYFSFSFFNNVTLTSKIFNKFADKDLVAENNYNCLNQDNMKMTLFEKQLNQLDPKYRYYLLYNYCQFFMSKNDHKRIKELHRKFIEIEKGNESYQYKYRLLRDHFRSMVDFANNIVEVNKFKDKAIQYNKKIPKHENCPGYVFVKDSTENNEFIILLAKDYTPIKS